MVIESESGSTTILSKVALKSLRELNLLMAPFVLIGAITMTRYKFWPNYVLIKAKSGIKLP